jgi:hypothetical protein
MAPELLQQQQHPSSSSAANHNNNNNTTATTPSTNTPPYDARAADAWALGVLLHLLLAGAYPFEDERHPSSVAHTVSNVLSGRRRPLPEWVSAEAQRVVAALLQPDPSRRTTLRELASDAWLLSSAGSYAKEVPGGAGLVDVSSVAAVPRAGGGGGGAAVGAAAPVVAAPPLQLPSALLPAVNTQQQQQQQQQQQPSPSPLTPTPPATPAAKGGGGASGGGGNAVQRLLASVAGVFGGGHKK